MLSLFLTFFKISITTFGGGSVIIALLQKEFVETGVINSTEFIKAIALSQATPGPIAGSVATYLGYNLGGVKGILVSNAGVALPSLIFVIIYSIFLNNLKNHDFIDNVLRVLRPVTIALIATVVIFYLKTTVFGKVDTISVLSLLTSIKVQAAMLYIAFLVLNLKYKINPMYILLTSAVAGAVIL